MSTHIPSTAFYDMESVRRLARKIGENPGKAMKEFRDSGYSRTFVNQMSERLRKAQMAQRRPEIVA